MQISSYWRSSSSVGAEADALLQSGRASDLERFFEDIGRDTVRAADDFVEFGMHRLQRSVFSISAYMVSARSI